MKILIIALLTTLAVAYVERAAPPTSTEPSELLRRLVRENSYELRVENGHLAGPGFDKLLAETRNSQFVSLGEEHMVREIPEIAVMLFDELHRRYDFNHLASETGTIQAEMMSQKPLVGNSDAIFAWVRSHKYGITFPTDQETEMFADIGRVSTRYGHPIWGLDQEFGALHVFERLVQIAPNDRAKNVAEQLRALAAQREEKRPQKNQFIANELTPDQLKELRDAFTPQPDSEADHLIFAVESSNRIYREYLNGEGYLNNSEREQYMKKVFLTEYQRAQHDGEKLPKVLLKAGHWHALRGLGPSHILTTGTFLDDIAFQNGMDCYIIAIHSNGPPGAWRRMDYPELKQIGDLLPNDKWTLLDLRALRRAESAGKLKELDPFAHTHMYEADAMLILGGDHEGTHQRLMQQ